MKRLTTLCAAVLMAAMSFAAVEYVLPEGAVTNDYGWKSKADICLDLQTDYNAAYSTSKAWAKLENGVVYYQIGTEWLTETEAQGSVCTVGGFLQAVTYNTTDNLLKLVTETNKDKYAWLSEYIVANRVTQDLTTALDETLYRYELSAFFLCSPAHNLWPFISAYINTGDYNAFATTWKHGFDNPTEVAEGQTWTLNAPYLEGMTFDGWYTEANGNGTRVTTINANTTGKLYAYFVPYINTVAEVLAMEDGTNDVKVKGVVTFIQDGTGPNFWIQDATGGILCYGRNHGLTEGEEVVLQGQKNTYYNSPELENAVVVKHETATYTPVAVSVTLADINSADTRYLNQLVYIEGLKMKEFQNAGSYYNPVVTDGVIDMILYNMGVEATAFPVGTKVNVRAIVSVFGETMQLRGKTEWVEYAIPAAKDTYNYPARHATSDFAGYTLKNEWIFANTYDNFSDNLPGPTDFVRGMAVKDGIMYFINRANESFTRVDGATGEMLDPLPITGEHLFETQGEDGVWSACVTLAYNDVKVDNAGNLLIGGCITGGNRFQIYKVDSETGAATMIINDRIYDHISDFDYRFDAFGVYGDVNGDAVIMTASANGWHAFRWNIRNGRWDGNIDIINLKPNENVPSLAYSPYTDDVIWNADNPGTCPQILPLANGSFYIDGWAIHPMLFDAGSANPQTQGLFDSYLLEDFAQVPTGVVVTNNEGEECTMNTGHNGLTEFKVGDEYFLLMAATHTMGSPTSAFALYKFKDANKNFAEMEPMWFFPANGMGSTTNGCRVAVPSVEVNGTEAKLYLYTNNNGYAVYTFTGKEKGSVDTPPDTDIYTGKCGEYMQLDWVYDTETATLTISGEGRLIYNYVPWAIRGQMQKLVIERGVTEVYETYGSNLTSIEIKNPNAYVDPDITRNAHYLHYISAPASAFHYDYIYPYNLQTVVVTGGELGLYGLQAFMYAYNLVSLDLGNTTDTELIIQELFANCNNLRTLILPNNLQRLDYATLMNTMYLPSISIPASVIEIGDRAFENCRSLQSVTFESVSQLQTIGDWAFYNCHNMQTINLPDGVREIGTGAFYGCSYASEFSLPASLTAIGDNAFALCADLSRMYVQAVVPPAVEERTFFEVSRTAPVYVPYESVETYKAHPVWGELNIVGYFGIPGEATGLNNTTNDTQAVKFLNEGNVYIRRNGKTYTIFGQEVK